jgi:hypothetical protein
LEIDGGFIGIFEDGKEFDLLKGCREAVQGHLIEHVLIEEEQI